MSNVYATEEETGKQILVKIECDFCHGYIKPHAEIATSGWMKAGTIWPDGSHTESHACPRCYADGKLK